MAVNASVQTRIEADFAMALTYCAFRNAGYVVDGMPEHQSEETECTTKSFLWWTWKECETYFYPQGNISIETPAGTTGLSGVQVKMCRWFRTEKVYTDGAGDYYCPRRWPSMLIGNNIDYTIVLNGRYLRQRTNEYSTWNLCDALFGAACLCTHTYNIGFKNPKGYSCIITNQAKKMWGRCILNNAIYDYNLYADLANYTYPSKNLSVATSYEQQLGKESCPFLKNHINTSLIYGSSFWGTIATFIAYPLMYNLLPDLILKYSDDDMLIEEMSEGVWHELTHASMVERMKVTKGLFWASDYWSQIVYQQAYNSLKGFSAYGSSVNDANGQIIALTEGWAKFREWYMGMLYLNFNTLGGTNDFMYYSSYINYNYAQMFKELYNIGCSMANLEESLAAYSIADFSTNLISLHSYKQTAIENIIQNYLPTP